MSTNFNISFPKVLIFGQPFNSYSGGGITLTNLFKGWPKDRIAVTYIGHGLFNATADVCDNYYQLGIEEHHRNDGGIALLEDETGLETEETDQSSLQQDHPIESTIDRERKHNAGTKEDRPGEPEMQTGQVDVSPDET